MSSELSVIKVDGPKFPSSPFLIAGTTDRDPLLCIRGMLSKEFGQNEPIATLLFLTYYSGGTRYPLSMQVSGQSSAGKTYLSRRVGDLFDPETIRFTSNTTVAGLFASKPPRALVQDEFIPDPKFAKIRRQLISTGTASRQVATSQGEERISELKAQVAFVECTLSDADRDFQDGNRTICCPLLVTPQTIEQNSLRTARAYTADGKLEAALWLKVRVFLNATAIRSGLEHCVVVFGPEVEQLAVNATAPHLPRRIKQVLNLASVIRLFRHFGSLSLEAPISPAEVLGTRQDIVDALDLLIVAGSEDDAPQINAKTQRFLSLFQHLVESAQTRATKRKPGVSVMDIVDRLNDPKLRKDVENIVDDGKRQRPVRSAEFVTRRIVDRHLKSLEDCGYAANLDKDSDGKRLPGRQKLWATTAAGASIALHGSVNLFEQMRASFEVAQRAAA